MQKFDELMEVAARLMGPDGCAWDRKQTFTSLQRYVLEEAHEVLEAVDSDVDEKIIEELGDLLYTVIFYAKVAQKMGRFSLEDILCAEIDKLVRRHPHVFGELKIESEQELEENWDRIKSQEKGKDKRVHPLDGIAPTMPLLPRTQKSIKVLLKALYPLFTDRQKNVCSEEQIGSELLHLVWLAELNDIDAESALRRALSKKVDSFLSLDK